jgi:hypothetical protein
VTQPSALVCSRCGAPLGAVGQDGLAHCEFCGTETRVAEPPRPPPTPSYDPRLAAQQLQFQADMSRVARRSTVLYLVLGVGITAFAAIFSGVMALVNGSGRSHASLTSPWAARASATSHSGPSFWSEAPPGCLVNGNGDHVLDVFGMAGESDALAPTIVDGSSGRVLWKAKAYPNETVSFCLSRDWLGVAEPNFLIELFPARQHAHPIAIKGRDKLSAFAIGHDCAELETADGSRFGVKLPHGGATHCRAGKLTPVRNDDLGLIGLGPGQTEIENDDTIYTLKKRPTGTPMLTVTATRGRRRLFSNDLSYAATTFASAIAVGGSRIVVWGAKPGARGKPFLIGLDARDGNELYALPQSGDSDGNVSFFEFNGRYVIATWSDALHAYDPATGREAWSVGLTTR